MSKQEVKTMRVVFVVAILCNVVNVGAGYTSIFGGWFDSNPTSTLAPSKNDNHFYGPDKKYTITEEQLTAIRIEYIKNQILRKLRLKHKPFVSKAFLPKDVIYSDSILPKVLEDDSSNPYVDDFYAKTTQVIIFPFEEETKCSKKVQYPSACLPFQLPKDIHATDVSIAELLVHKKPDKEDVHQQTFIISEIAHWDAKKSFQKTTPIYINQTNVKEGWLKIDVTQIVKNWLDNKGSLTHAINVACKSCGRKIGDSPISSKEKKPYLVIQTHSQQRRTTHKRTKRYADCLPGNSECCRESLYVSFADIGWDDWIISPSGYNAYFCKGSCNSATAKTLSASQHNSILQKVMYGPNRNSGNRLELTTCCAGTQFQSLQLFYVDNNKTLTSKILSNMIVETCGCM